MQIYLLFLSRVGRYPLARWARAKDVLSGIVHAAAKARYFAARSLQHGHAGARAAFLLLAPPHSCALAHKKKAPTHGQSLSVMNLNVFIFFKKRHLLYFICDFFPRPHHCMVLTIEQQLHVDNRYCINRIVIRNN